MSFLNEMLSRLTDHFKKDKESNIGKLFAIVDTELDQLNETLSKMEEWRDIDNAEGKALDDIGEKIVGEFRGSSNDEEYRLRIKTKIAINFLAYSDIESINRLFRLYLNEYYAGTQECWNVKDTPWDGEPAALLVTVKGNGNPYGIPFFYLDRVGIGGVGLRWRYLFEDNFESSGDYQSWSYPFELYAGEVIASETLYETTD